MKEGVRFNQEIGNRGLLAVLQERGVILDLKKNPNTGKKWIRCEMVEALQSQADFQEDVNSSLAQEASYYFNTVQ